MYPRARSLLIRPGRLRTNPLRAYELEKRLPRLITTSSVACLQGSSPVTRSPSRPCCPAKTSPSANSS